MRSRFITEIRKPEDLTALVERFGFLPFFSTTISGFSIDDLTPATVWDAYLGLGPWLWRDEIAREKRCIYGKFFNKKTGYISAEWFPHLANYRRDGYDFDARCDGGLARSEDIKLYEIIRQHGPITAPELRCRAMVDSKHASRFEAALTRLQMMTYIVPVDFIFPCDSLGNKKYSYGITVYDLPEHWLGEAVCCSQYHIEPGESFQRMVCQLTERLQTTEKERIVKLLK